MTDQVILTRRNTLLAATTLAAASSLGTEVAFAPSTAGAQTATSTELGNLPPWPDQLTASVQARVGAVELKNGLPTPKGIQQLFAIQDFQRATQLYQWALPMINLLGA